MTFVVAGAVAVGIVAAGALYTMRQVGRDEAVRDAADRTNLLRLGVIQPDLTDAILRSDPAEITRLDRVVRERIAPTGVVRVKIWDDTGRILYADDHRLIGRRYALAADDMAVLRHGGRTAGPTDLSAPENQFEPRGRPVIEVYDQLKTPSGRSLLLETYWLREQVVASGNQLWRDFFPAALIALLVLGLVQIPLAYSLARRVRSGQEEQERLLRNAIESSDAERFRIASDLHDGVVQDLAGVSFTLAALAEELKSDPRPELVSSLRDASQSTRRGIRQLRTLLVDLYPPNLREAGIESALEDLLARLSSAGITTSLDVGADVVLTADEEALVYRTAREATRNARDTRGRVASTFRSCARTAERSSTSATMAPVSTLPPHATVTSDCACSRIWRAIRAPSSTSRRSPAAEPMFAYIFRQHRDPRRSRRRSCHGPFRPRAAPRRQRRHRGRRVRF